MATKANLFNEAHKQSKSVSKSKDKAIINDKAKSAISVKSNGTTSMTSGIYAQNKIDKQSGTITQSSLNSVETTVTKEISCSDFIINKHKLNTQLIEFTNLMHNMETIMGNLTLNTTVLVKAWEPTLEKFVLIRRPARHAMFGNLLDAYVVDERLDTEGDYTEDILEYKRNIKDLNDPTKEGK